MSRVSLNFSYIVKGLRASSWIRFDMLLVSLAVCSSFVCARETVSSSRVLVLQIVNSYHKAAEFRITVHQAIHDPHVGHGLDGEIGTQVIFSHLLRLDHLLHT